MRPTEKTPEGHARDPNAPDEHGSKPEYLADDAAEHCPAGNHAAGECAVARAHPGEHAVGRDRLPDRHDIQACAACWSSPCRKLPSRMQREHGWREVALDPRTRARPALATARHARLGCPRCLPVTSGRTRLRVAHLAVQTDRQFQPHGPHRDRLLSPEVVQDEDAPADLTPLGDHLGDGGGAALASERSRHALRQGEQGRQAPEARIAAVLVSLALASMVASLRFRRTGERPRRTRSRAPLTRPRRSGAWMRPLLDRRAMVDLPRPWRGDGGSRRSRGGRRE